jgi:sugar phosphate isomerase/epimerase
MAEFNAQAGRIGRLDLYAEPEDVIAHYEKAGFDIVEEFELYGNRISDIHIKDRELNGGSVELGSGNADFNLFLKLFEKLNFNGPIIMQVYRDDEGIEIFKKQFDWFKKQIENEHNSSHSS